MSCCSKAMLCLLQRTVRTSPMTLPKLNTIILSGGQRFSQNRSLSSVVRMVGVKRVFETQFGLNSSCLHFCTTSHVECQRESDLQKREVFIIQVKGLPWSCTAQDLLEFFSECRINDGLKGIHLTTNATGRPSGQAFIEMEHEDDVSRALQKHRQYLGPRYVEVFEVTNADAEAILKNALDDVSSDYVVHLRGLPFSSSEADIMTFFSGLDIVENGITIVTDRQGRNSGRAFVEFASQEALTEALRMDGNLIGNRYIDIFPSAKNKIHPSWKKTSDVQQNSDQNVDEVTDAEAILKNAVDGASSDYVVCLRGLPFSSSETDITNFFSGLDIVENGITIVTDHQGRNSGRAFVEFTSQEAFEEALRMNREFIGDRYIIVSPSAKDKIHPSWKRTSDVIQNSDQNVDEVTDAEVILKNAVDDAFSNFVVCLRGLPFSSSETDITNFFSGLDIVENGITIVTDKQGRNSGKAFVEFTSQEVFEEALRMDRELIGDRHIEVFPSAKNEIHTSWERTSEVKQNSDQNVDKVPDADTEAILKTAVDGASSDYVVRIRGLSYSSSETDITNFFSGLDIVKNGITIVTDHFGRNTGTAFVEFTSQEVFEEALRKDREFIRDRYIEVFPSKKTEIHYFRSGVLSNRVHMRGVPFSASGKDFAKFFSPLVVSKVLIDFGPDGRPSGKADVYFRSHQDAVEAMSSDKKLMGERYIDLFNFKQTATEDK